MEHELLYEFRDNGKTIYKIWSGPKKPEVGDLLSAGDTVVGYITDWQPVKNREATILWPSFHFIASEYVVDPMYRVKASAESNKFWDNLESVIP